MKYPDNFVDKFICGDCLDVMKMIPDGVVGMVLTDPPYGISSDLMIKRGAGTKFSGTDISHNFGEWDKFRSLYTFMSWTYSWLDEAVRCLRPGGVLVSYFDRDKINFMSVHLQDKQFKLRGYYADCKSNPVPQARKVKWMNGWEELGLWQKPGGKLAYNYQLGQEKDWSIRPVVGHTTKEDGAREHPTQKPIMLMKKFIRYWSNPDDIILDPFAGVGTVLVAAKACQRHFIGIEKDECFHQFISRRLAQEILSFGFWRPEKPEELGRQPR